MAGATVYMNGDVPPDWTDPLATNLDGTTNLYRTVRFWMYCVSLQDAVAGYNWITLQTTAWSGADHFDLTPTAQPAALDATTINPNTISGPLYKDVNNMLNLQIASDFVVSGGVLTQNTVNLAKAVNFNTSAFTTTGGSMSMNASWILAQAIGVNQLIAGSALFTGTATFAYLGGAEVQIGGAGITLADNYSSPSSTITITASGPTPGITIANGANSVQVTSGGVAINNGVLTLNLNGITTTIKNQVATVAGGNWYTGFQCKNNTTLNWTGISELGLGAFTPSSGYAILFSNQLAIYNASGVIQGSHTATQITLGGLQVVGTRQTLTLSSGTDTATGWADSRAMADFNALLAVLRNGHGLIS